MCGLRVRRLAEAEVDARREQVFGRSSARRASASHIFGDEPGGGGGVNAAERFPSHRRDFLGYYKLLDIALEGACAVSLASVLLFRRVGDTSQFTMARFFFRYMRVCSSLVV